MTPAQIEQYRRDPAAFIDASIPKNEKGKTWSLSPYQRRVLKLAIGPNGTPPRMLIWGEPKKSGKTMLEACLDLWWGYTHPYTEIIVAANDLEQSIGRVFKTAAALVRHNPLLLQSAKPRQTSTATAGSGETLAATVDHCGA